MARARGTSDLAYLRTIGRAVRTPWRLLTTDREVVEAGVGATAARVRALLWPEGVPGVQIARQAHVLAWRTLPLHRAAWALLVPWACERLVTPSPDPAGENLLSQLLDRPDLPDPLWQAMLAASAPQDRVRALAHRAVGAGAVRDLLEADPSPRVYAALLAQPELPPDLRAAWAQALAPWSVEGPAAQTTALDLVNCSVPWGAGWGGPGTDRRAPDLAAAARHGVLPVAEAVQALSLHPEALDAWLAQLHLPVRLLHALAEAALRQHQPLVSQRVGPEPSAWTFARLTRVADRLAAHPEADPRVRDSLERRVLRDPAGAPARWGAALLHVAGRDDLGRHLDDPTVVGLAAAVRVPGIAARLLALPDRGLRLRVLALLGHGPENAGTSEGVGRNAPGHDGGRPGR